MIISRTPVRIPLGGGGTDLPAYSQKFGGSLLTAAVNRYVFILVNKHFEDTIRFSGYYHKEVVDSADEIRHPVVGAAHRFLNIPKGVEIVAVSDVPANVGLGTSSSFAVGLLNALHAFKGENPSKQTLAEEALTIERVMLSEPGGIQDQYIAAYGGLLSIDINTKGKVALTPLEMDGEVVANLERRLVFFYTKLQRSATEVQTEHVQAITSGENGVIESLHEIKRIGLKSKEALMTGNLDYFGGLLDEHWNCKRRLGANISNGSIDRWYNMAINAGALGGKLMGAGGGGFLMFYCHPDVRSQVRNALNKEGLQEISLRFEPTGSKIILNI